MTGRNLLISSFSAVLLAAGAAQAADHPGQRFQISPASLPKPYETPAAGNQSDTIARPAGLLPEVPRGFAI